jgi:phage terminase large subunit-like protein
MTGLFSSPRGAWDEESPLEIYMEGLTRTNATGGMVYLTFTPLLGITEVVSMFLKDCWFDGSPMAAS